MIKKVVFYSVVLNGVLCCYSMAMTAKDESITNSGYGVISIINDEQAAVPGGVTLYESDSLNAQSEDQSMVESDDCLTLFTQKKVGYSLYNEIRQRYEDLRLNDGFTIIKLLKAAGNETSFRDFIKQNWPQDQDYEKIQENCEQFRQILLASYGLWAGCRCVLVEPLTGLVVDPNTGALKDRTKYLNQ